MSLRINKRWILVVLVAAGQLALLIPGSWWLAGQLNRAMRDIAEQRLAVATSRHVIQIAGLIEDLLPNDYDGAAEDHFKLQQLILRTGRPYGATLFVIRTSSGQIVASPEPAATAPETKPIALRELPALGLTLLAVPHEGDVASLVEQFDTYMRWVIIALLIVVVLGSTLLTTFIVRRYESRLAGINIDLEALVKSRSQDLLKSRSAVIFGLAMLAESRDGETGQHLKRIRLYVRILGDDLKRILPEVDDEFVNTIEETSALHDIGKVGVPDHVLRTPEQLTEQERKIIRKHTFIGFDTMIAVKRQWGDDPFLTTACEICSAHHEHWDGKGYPFGLKGDTIPLSARIVALADVYDALTSRRVYKDAVSHDSAREYIVKESGSHFDPTVVKAFVRCEEAFKNVVQADEV